MHGALLACHWHKYKEANKSNKEHGTHNGEDDVGDALLGGSALSLSGGKWLEKKDKVEKLEILTFFLYSKALV